MKVAILVLFTLFSVAISQEVDTLEESVGYFFENLETDLDLDEIIEGVEFTRIELNKVTVDNLVEFPFITRDVAAKIISYRDKIGGFKNKEQVFEIPGVNDLVKYFLYRNGYISKPKLSFQMRSRLLNKGNLSSFGRNFNNSSKTYQLARLSLSSFSGGFILEKDYTERKFNDLMYFYIDYKGSGSLQKFIVGNYSLMFGQGALMWKPTAIGKGGDAVLSAIRSSGSYVSGYISTDEVKPLAGASMSSRFKNFELILFYSKSKLPSQLDTSGLVKYIDFSGINTRLRSQLFRNLFGGILSFEKPNFLLGFLMYREKFDNDFSPSISRPFHKENLYYGFEYSVFVKNLNLFGEIASSKLFYFSAISGLSIFFKDLELVFLYRNLNPNFTSINGNAFGERYGEAWNEEGFYSGVKFKIGRVEFSGYYDIFKFPRQNLYDVKRGTDNRIELNLKISRNAEVRLLRKEKLTFKGDKIYDELGRYSFVESTERRESWRFEVENRFKKVRFRSRVEFLTRKSNEVESGFLIYQGVSLDLFKSLRFYGRISLFRSDSYWSRIYVYEDDIDGVVSLVPLYGRGLRWYFVLKYNYGSKVSFQFKYGETVTVEDRVVGNMFGVQLNIKI